MFRLIVRFHRHSLGRQNVADSVHWRDGVLLRDRYGARALIMRDRDRIRITVRGVYPHAFLYALMQEVRDCIEQFWKGLTTQVLVPCQTPCGRQTPGCGMFDLDKLYSRRYRGMPDYPCPAPECDHDADIDVLLRGIEQRTSSGATDPVGASTAAVAALLEQQTLRILDAVTAGNSRVLGRIEELDGDTKATFSRIEANLAALLRSLGDEAADGPRLFTVEHLGASVRHPGLTTTQLRLTLWCEHSRLPVHLLDPEKPAAGRYTVTVPRDWWAKAAPVLRAVSATVRALLPISVSIAELELSTDQWAEIRRQVNAAKDGLDAAAQGVGAVPAGTTLGATAASGAAAPAGAEGGLLRQFHAALREQDIGYADLRRVQPTHGGYLWVHPRFLPFYHRPLPDIPSG